MKVKVGEAYMYVHRWSHGYNGAIAWGECVLVRHSVCLQPEHMWRSSSPPNTQIPAFAIQNPTQTGPSYTSSILTLTGGSPTS